MSRMPGRGVGPRTVVTGSTLHRSARSRASAIGQRRRGKRQGVTAERQYPVKCVTQLLPEAFEPRVRDPYETVDFDQVDDTAGMLAAGKEGAVQPERRES